MVYTLCVITTWTAFSRISILLSWSPVPILICQPLKIKLEVVTDLPASFATETRYLLSMPVAFAVRTVAAGDLFVCKMRAVLCSSTWF